MSRDELITWLNRIDDGYGNRDEMQMLLFLGVINIDNRKDTEKVTRFEVIDHRSRRPFHLLGRVYSVQPCKVELSYQDDDRTLKVFVNDSEASDGNT